MNVSTMTVAQLTEGEHNMFVNTIDLLERIQSIASQNGFDEMDDFINELVQHLEVFVARYMRNENEVWFR